MTDRELMQQALEALSLWAGEDANHTEQYAAYHALRERLAQPEQKTCLLANEPCKHGSWCSEVYCQEHCKFVEQPARQQEPVAYSYTSRITGAQGFSHHPMPRFIDSESWDIQPLYTSPPASKPWVGLTDEERDSFWRADQMTGEEWRELFDAIEAKIKEKNV